MNGTAQNCQIGTRSHYFTFLIPDRYQVWPSHHCENGEMLRAIAAWIPGLPFVLWSVPGITISPSWKQGDASRDRPTGSRIILILAAIPPLDSLW